MTAGVSGDLAALFRAGAARASETLAAWLGRPATVVLDGLVPLPMEEAVAVLGAADEPICGCAMAVAGDLSGVLLLAAGDDAGLALADLLLERPAGSSTAWGDLERSAVVETANIVGCGYLNAIAAGLRPAGNAGILPSPPWFVRDYPSAVMQAALAGQAAAETVLLATSRFHIDGVPVRCGLVFVPDDAGLERLGLPHPAE